MRLEWKRRPFPEMLACSLAPALEGMMRIEALYVHDRHSATAEKVRKCRDTTVPLSHQYNVPRLFLSHLLTLEDQRSGAGSIEKKSGRHYIM